MLTDVRNECVEEKKTAFKLVTVRLGIQADAVLRRQLERKGDISKLIMNAISASDPMEIDVASQKKRQAQNFIETSMKFERKVHESLMAIAKSRGVSTAALLEAIILNNANKEKNGKLDKLLRILARSYGISSSELLSAIQKIKATHE